MENPSSSELGLEHLPSKNTSETLKSKLACSLLFARVLKDAKSSITSYKPQRLAQIAQFEFATGQDPQPSLNEAIATASGWKKEFMQNKDDALLEIIRAQIKINQIDAASSLAKNIESPDYLAFALQEIALAKYQTGESPDQELTLADPISRRFAREKLAVTYAKVGQIDTALETVEKLTGDDRLSPDAHSDLNVEVLKGRALAEISQIQSARGDINGSFETLQKIKYEDKKIIALVRLAEAQFKAGGNPEMIINQAITDLSSSAHNSIRDYLVEIARAQVRLNLDPNPILDKIRKSYRDPNTTAQLALIEFEMGQDPTKTLQEAAKFSKRSLAIADAMITVGLDPTKIFLEAFKYAENTPPGHDKSMNLLQVAEVLQKMTLSPGEIAILPPDEVRQMLIQSNSRLASEAAGYFNKVDLGELSNLPTQIQTSVLIGQALDSEDEREKNKFLTEARNVALENSETSPNRLNMKNFVEGVISTQNYETASNILLATLNQLQKIEDTRLSQSQTVRLLRGLINIDNPKAKTLATQLFGQTSLPPRDREYLAKLLFSTNYWDQKLGSYLEDQTESHYSKGTESVVETLKRQQHPIRKFTESLRRKWDSSRLPVTKPGLMLDLTDKEFELKDQQSAILSALINDFGLTPDLPAYKLLEKPGVLVADTLEGRILETKSKMTQFEGKTRDELLQMFKEDPAKAKIYYILKAGEYRYSVVNDYSLEKFEKITSRVSELQVHKPTLERFQTVLASTGMSEAESKSIITDIEAGKPMIVGPDRTIRFSSQVEYGSSAEMAIQRLQDVWLTELKSLLVASAAGVTPQTIGESVQILDNSELVEANKAKTGNIVRALKIDRQKITYDDIKNVVKDLRNRLETTYKSAKNKQAQSRIANLSDSGIIAEYLTPLLPSAETTPATTEWLSHLQETISSLEEAKAQSGTGLTSKGNRDLELTFLDKNEDFVRSLRFADAAQCCFNASNGNFDRRTYEFVTRLNKDPLSFMMDLKEANSKVIQGFVFGRMGLNPSTGKPIIMLNGIYSQLKGPVMVDNILKIIEAQMGKKINAENIVIASQYGGAIQTPTDYNRGEIKIEAVRALQDNKGNPESKVYDDIGRVANGTFKFEGFIKKLAT